MTVWSFCPTQIREVLDTVRPLNKGQQEHLLEYRRNWVNWIHKFSGCEHKQEWAFANGIHDALLNQVVHVHTRVRKFYVFSTDYKFYPVLLRSFNHSVISPDDIAKIEPHSYVIVSQPNHEGGITPWFQQLVAHCRATDSKIFLDCAFYGTTFDTLDTSDPVYDAVAFSLSKNFLLGGLRAGIVFGDNLAPSLTVPISKHYDYNYYNILAVQCANAILPRFDHNYVTRWAKLRQVEYCAQYGLRPADIWMWAFDDDTKICITEQIRRAVQSDLDSIGVRDRS